MLHTFKPSYILTPSLGLGAGWDTPGHDSAMGQGGFGGMGIHTLIDPKHWSSLQGTSTAAFPLKAGNWLPKMSAEWRWWLCVVPFPTGKGISHKRPLSTFQMRWLSPRCPRSPLGVAVSQRCVTRNKRTSQCKATLWFSAAFAGEHF